MRYEYLGRSDLLVSKIGLGSSFWGGGIPKIDAFQQLDQGFSLGINLIDTAEIYPSPYSSSTWGNSERIIGEWLKSKKIRGQVIVSTKVAGRSRDFPYIRNGQQQLDRYNVMTAVDASLRRLQCDYIDLFQMHWPDRNTDIPSEPGYQLANHEDEIPIEETLSVLNDVVSSGKVRQIGICNETPWGVMQHITISNNARAPRIVSVQHRYNLLCRGFEISHGEIASREQCSLLAYSPLAHGTLTGKYSGESIPPKSRLNQYSFFQRYRSDHVMQAANAYVRIARDHGLSPSQMAIAYILTKPWVASTLIAVTTLAQLNTNVASVDMSLPADVLHAIEAYHNKNPNPAP